MFFNKLKISVIIGFVVLAFSLAYASEPNPTDAQIKHERTKLLAKLEKVLKLPDIICNNILQIEPAGSQTQCDERYIEIFLD